MYVEVVKVTRHYQVVIPASVRKALGIKEGDYVAVWYDEVEKVVKIKRLDPLEEVEEELGKLPKAKVNWKELKKYVYEMFD